MWRSLLATLRHWPRPAKHKRRQSNQPKMTYRSFIELPPELLLSIVSFLPVPDILRCECVSTACHLKTTELINPFYLQLCRYMHEVLTESSYIQYKIELFASQHFDTFFENRYDSEIDEQAVMPVAERLRILQDLQTGWRLLKFEHHSSIGVDFPLSLCYELSAGSLILGTGDMDLMNPTATLNVLQLPHRPKEDNEIPELQWKAVKLPFSIADFALDATQNLLVFVTRSM